MKLVDTYPLITAADLAAQRDFYVRHFAATVAFEASWLKLSHRRRPWGQRRFMVRDRAGVLIDVVEQTEPAAGFWERYAAPA